MNTSKDGLYFPIYGSLAYKVNNFLVCHDRCNTICNKNLFKKHISIVEETDIYFSSITMNAAGLLVLIVCRTKSGSAETPYRFRPASPNALLVASVPKIPIISKDFGVNAMLTDHQCMKDNETTYCHHPKSLS